MYIGIKGNNGKEYGFTVVKANTKKAIGLIENYKYSDFLNTELYHIYKSNSTAKQNALNSCKEMCHALNGHNGHIISHNSQTFTYGFEFICDGTTKLAYITAFNNYIVDGLE